MRGFSPGNANPISLELKNIAGSLDPEYACDDILKGIDQGRWMIISGATARVTAFIARHWPAGFFGFMRFNIHRLMRKYGVPQ